MAVISALISQLALDQIFLSGDVKTTTVAIAITGSLCCSIVWLIVHLLVTVNPESGSSTPGERKKSKGDAVAAFHIKRASSLHNRRYLQKRGSNKKKQVLQVIHRDSLKVICISCGLNEAHWTCRLVLCETCCLSSKYTTCDLGIADVDARVKVTDHDVKKPKEIDLSYFQLTSCPSRIGYVGAQLLILNLSNNCLSDLPKEIGFLLGLEELYLQYNCLIELPQSIGNLSKLTELDVKHNNLTSLPDSIGNLSSLNILNLMNNRLLSLPHTIGQLTQLQILYASNNGLVFLPEELCELSQLDSLYLCGNQSLSSLPDSMGNLVRLAECDVSDCHIVHLPNSMSKCRALVKMWCNNNRLLSLPEHIGQLHQLRELHIRENNVQHLPASMVHLDLHVFSATHNPLYEENRQDFLQSAQKLQPPDPVATLVELSARQITNKKIPWDQENLPAILKDLLLNRRNCSMCECPIFEHFFMELEFQTISIAQRIPVHTQLCEQCFKVSGKKKKVPTATLR